MGRIDLKTAIYGCVIVGFPLIAAICATIVAITDPGHGMEILGGAALFSGFISFSGLVFMSLE